MILGFWIGFWTGVAWSLYLASFYDKPLPPTEQEIVISGDTARLVRRNGS